MFSILKNRFGVPGVIAVIALVFAMIGGAYAANDNGNATASAKAKKGPRGPRGPKGPKGDTGPAGPAGAAGPAGPAGLKGANGADGAKGDTGAKGSNGAAGAKGATGAAGATGATGPEGSPWTAGGTLPSGETETGVWQTSPQAEPGTVSVQVSLPIPLETALAGGGGEDNQFIFLAAGEGGTEKCPGTLQDPQAAPGSVCIYTLSESEAAPLDVVFGPTKSGASMLYSISEVGGFATGSWAVTAP